MSSFGVTARRLYHARSFIIEAFSRFISRVRNSLAQLVGGVQTGAVTLAGFSSVSTQRQVLNAIIFLYRHFLDQPIEEQIVPALRNGWAGTPLGNHLTPACLKPC